MAPSRDSLAPIGQGQNFLTEVPAGRGSRWTRAREGMGGGVVGVLAQGGDFDDLYPDVYVEGFEKDPF